MTQTYAQIQRKIAALQQSADALRHKEVAGVVARIKTAIEHYGLTAHQLGFGGAVASAKASAKRPGVKSVKSEKSDRAAKYSDGNGKSWSGIGKRPFWIRDALAAGKSLDDFLTGTAPALGQVAKVRSKRLKQKRSPSTLLYRDGAGNSWTGRGPQPRWMKEAIAGGKTLEELKG
ncbi:MULTISPECIES: H-NS family nucleoid-associated regulatory protein [unclassified Variovorax]|uniref:H-NS family nucleoid-associated regulatory protein n=1 Tax=unclassified Variovorax TaxID=663243 RepID=UPI00076DAE4B|nr:MULTISPECIES: H-NS family nucleoid-associated regulatory protein [unclassified Variovorax]KWT70890.1 putative HNS-like transcription regulator protein [Variovorax sp. WDL1]PNG49259.1 hypothetical protein CHC06_06496 [Variovorax sp. B2]PNG49644.1 hypothetical protein CHC07_06553 [Variovorax sp. B4]VTV18677.1 DNA binding protein, nucleoid-associated [Variovorax sp. WDL1]